MRCFDLGHGARGLRGIHRHPHHLGSGLGQLDALARRRLGIGRVRHRHALDDDGRAAADLNVADENRHGAMQTKGERHDSLDHMMAVGGVTMRVIRIVIVALCLFISAATASLWAQVITAADLTRLETTAGDIERLAGTLKKSDATLATAVERTLADLRDEIAYLRVKLRKEGSVTRDEYTALRDRLETLKIKAQGSDAGKVSIQPVLDDPSGKAFTIAVGTELDVRLQTPLNSGTAKIEQRFEATTIQDYTVGRAVAIPAGAVVRGFVSSVKMAGKIDRQGSLTLSFDELRMDNRTYRLRASVLQAMDGKASEDYTRIGAVAGAGAAIGAALGGLRGALIGIVLGGGGAIAATTGTDIDLPVGTILKIRFDQPVGITR